VTAKKKHLTIRKKNQFGYPYILARHEIMPIHIGNDLYTEAHFVCYANGGEVTLRQATGDRKQITARYTNAIGVEMNVGQIADLINSITVELDNAGNVPRGLEFKPGYGVLV